MKTRMAYYIAIGLVTLLALSLGGLVQARGQKMEIKTGEHRVTGPVGGISKNFIAVVYRREKGTEEELAIQIDGAPQFEHVKNMSEIALGDTVTVTYADIAVAGEDGKERTKRVARKISFVQKAPPAPPEEPLPPEPIDEE